jgi:uncharacterized protein YerC
VAIMDRTIQAQRRERATQLLEKGCTTRQISERTGMTTRTVLRLKKKLEHEHEQQAAVT